MSAFAWPVRQWPLAYWFRTLVALGMRALGRSMHVLRARVDTRVGVGGIEHVDTVRQACV